MKKVICLFFCILALAGCSDQSSKFRGEVLAGCIQGGGSKAVCKCGVEKLEREYGDQLETTALSQLSPSFIRALLECRTGKTSATPSQSPAADSFQTSVTQALTSPNTNTTTGGGADGRTTSNNAAHQTLDKAITEQVNLRTKYAGGSEYRDGRKILEADFNGDHASDAIVLYTVEGAGAGNAVVHTLALFFGNQGNYFAQGSTVVEGASDITLSNDGGILVTSLMHGPDDSDCCPSMKSTAQYRVEGNQLLPMP